MPKLIDGSLAEKIFLHRKDITLKRGILATSTRLQLW